MMSPRLKTATLFLAATAPAAAWLFSEIAFVASQGGESQSAASLVVAYAFFSTLVLGLNGGLTPPRKVALVTASLLVSSLLARAVTARLGVLSLPALLLGPSAPFLAASAWLSPPEHDPGAADFDPSPTLSSLLRGKHLRSSLSSASRKPTARPDALDEPLF